MPFILLLLIIVFIISYTAIAFEHHLRVNKTAAAILAAVLCWIIVAAREYTVHGPQAYVEVVLSSLNAHLHDIAQIIIFFMGAMTIVELIDSHGGFKIITDFIRTRSRRKLLWVTSIVTFFLSSVLDNLTTAIVMVSLLRKVVEDREDRMIFACMVIIAANAGGAWSPIGDMTTTMLWIDGQVTAANLMKFLFIPSIFSLLVPLAYFSSTLKPGAYAELARPEDHPAQHGAKRVFFLGIGLLIFVPVFRALTNLPPFMGILLGLGVMWVMTDLIHDDGRQHLKIPSILTRIDFSSILFFLGILLAVAALETAGILESLALKMDHLLHSKEMIAAVLGVLSAIIDNVPLTAAAMGMYPLSTTPTDSGFWQLIAFCVGTGGSLLIIGSAAGVVVMGREKVNFIWYMKKISFPALIGYAAGIAAFVALHPILK